MKKPSFKELIDSANDTNKITHAVLAEAAAEVNEERQKRMKTALKSVIGNFTTNLEGSVKQLRDIRKKETAAKQLVANVQKALTNFEKTANPFPVFNALSKGDKSVREYAARDFCNQANIEMPETTDTVWDS